MNVLKVIFLITAFFFTSTSYAEFSYKTWSALLHLETSKPYIQSEEFYLSTEKTAESELQAHIAAFKSKNGGKLACKYPARFQYIKRHFDLPDYDLSKCTDLSEFLNLAPSDEIDLVFASESFTRPASAMGHTLLKISGLNSENLEVEHNISFFTRMDDVDPFTLVFQSFLFGKEGFYTLSPYRKTRDYYLYGEGRNLFEYRLKMTPFEKKLIGLHLYELKEIKFTYFFHAFNCATLLRNILAIAYPPIAKEGHLWVTPLDLVRFMRKNNHIEHTDFRSTSAWKIKRLKLENQVHENLSDKQNKDLSGKDRFSTYLFLKAKNAYNFEIGKKDKADYLRKKDQLKEEYKKWTDLYQQDVSDFKDPSFTIQDSSIGLVYLNTREGDIFGLDILPVSHYLINDLSGYDFESEARVSSIKLGINDKDNEVKLLEWKPLFLLSLIPHDSTTGGWATKIDLSYTDGLNGYDQLYSGKMLRGKAFRVLPDIDLYLMIGAQANSLKGGFLYAEAEAGAVIREIFNMKTHIYGNHFRNFSGVDVSSISVDHGISLGNAFITLKYQKTWKALSKFESEFENYQLGGHYTF